MGKNIVRLLTNKRKAILEANQINKSLFRRNIKREAYVTPVSKSYVKKLTRKGFPIPKNNYAIAVRNITKKTNLRKK